VASTTPGPGRDDPSQNELGQGPGQRSAEPGLVVARPFGIPVIISPYWFVIAGVFIFLYANEWGAGQRGTTRYAVAAAFVVLLYASVLVHELSHSLVARHYHLPVRRILLYPLGGVSEIVQEPQTPAREFIVSAAGPALSLVLAAGGYALSKVVSGATVTGEIVEQLWWANLVVGLFNLLPGLPLDGGRMLRAVIWQFTKKPAAATIAAAWAGRVLAVALLVVPFAIDLGRDETRYMQTTLWLAIVAAFMWIGATQAIRATRFRERVPALQARKLARKAISVTASTPLAEAVRRAEESSARAVVVVDHDDKPIAIVKETAVTATPPQRRPWIDTGSLARTLEPNLILPADLSGVELLNALRRAPATEYLLVEPSGQVYGVLAASDVEQAFAGV
jgi:Zn-dependent protease/CBS domain-containing protein